MLFGKGDLTFYAAPLYPTRGVPLRMAVGDLNGDRRPDIVTANRGGSGPAGLNIFLSQGEGRFQALAPIVITGASPSSAAIADLNGDGRADLLVGDGARRVWILLGGGNGTFQTPVSYPAATEVKDVVAVDSNGDGRPDVVAAASDAGVLLYPANANGTLGAATSIAAGSHPFSIAAADLNGDSRPDLVVTNFGTFDSTSDPGSISVLFGTAAGTFQPAVNYGGGRNPERIAIADFNADGRPDLAVSTRGPNFGFFVGILLGEGGGRFRNVSLITTDFGPAGVTPVDLNGDGKLDLAVAHCCGDTDLTYMQGNGDGTFQREIHIGTLSPVDSAQVDLNGDSKPDLIVASGDTSSGAVTILLNTSRTSLAVSNVSAASLRAGPVAPESIVTAFGTGLATGTAEAQSTPLPTTLAGTSISVVDSAGTSQAAPLIYVSPAQVNYIVPAGVALGAASITITAGNGAAGTATQVVERVAPGLFAGAGGLAAANILRVAADGSQTLETVTAEPINFGPDTDQLFLLLYGTGIRFFQSSATATMGGEDAEVLFAGAQGSFRGLDQVNLRIPRSLTGRGLVDVQLTVDGKVANVVRINLR